MSNEPSVQWEFEKSGAFQHNPSSDKHFEADCNGLVREVIQNSLDAKAEEAGKVIVKIKRKKLSSKGENLLSSYSLKSLRPHLKECIRDRIYKKLAKEGNSYQLSLEDFNTTGLSNEKAEQFLRKENNHIDNQKRTGGSHGIGKAVLFSVSSIKTIVAYSEREDEPSIIEGSSRLRHHEISGEKFIALGRTTNANLAEVKKQFGFQRNESENGLSIIIPFLTPKITFEGLKSAVIENCYLPILQDKLEVVLENDEGNSKSEKIVINSSYLADQQSLEWYDVVLDGLTMSQDQCIQENIDILSPEISEDSSLKIVQKLKEGNVIAININLFGKKGKIGELKICVKSSPKTAIFKPIPDVWRDNLLIVNATKRSNYNLRNTYAVITIGGENNLLAGLLRKLENVAHTDWELNENVIEELSSNYNKSTIEKTISIVKKLPSMIDRLMQDNEPREADNKLLAKFCPKGSVGVPPPPPPPPPESESPIALNKILDDNQMGIRVALTNKGFSLLPKGNCNVSIVFAYGIWGRNPFKAYSSLDFSLESKEIRILVSEVNKPYVQLMKTELNSLTLSISFPFKGDKNLLTVIGFDSRRELVANAQFIENSLE